MRRKKVVPAYVFRTHLYGFLGIFLSKSISKPTLSGGRPNIYLRLKKPIQRLKMVKSFLPNLVSFFRHFSFAVTSLKIDVEQSAAHSFFLFSIISYK